MTRASTPVRGPLGRVPPAQPTRVLVARTLLGHCSLPCSCQVCVALGAGLAFPWRERCRTLKPVARPAVAD